MAAIIGTVPTRLLISTGDGEPIEIGSFDFDMVVTGRRSATPGVTISMRRWRRRLTVLLIRMAWATLTARSDGPPAPPAPPKTRGVNLGH